MVEPRTEREERYKASQLADLEFQLRLVEFDIEVLKLILVVIYKALGEENPPTN